MKKLLLILSVLLSFGAQASNFFITGQGGYLKLTQDKATENDVTPSGFSFAGGGGIRKEYLEFEALILKGKAEDDLNHDGKDNKLVHEQTSVIFAMNFYLNKSLYIRAGYGLHKVDQHLKEEVNAASEQGAKEAYGIVESKLTEGMVVGAGLVLINARSMDFFTQIEKFSYSSISSGAWNASLGFRYYLQ